MLVIDWPFRCMAACRLWLILLLVLLVGCSDQALDQRFRYVDKWQQFAGHNGLGLHRRMWELSGVRCFAPARLSNRLKNVDVIVLAGSTFDPPGREARQWLEQWLRNSPGRSVIYFGRDFDASSFYFQRTLDQLSPAQQILAQDRISRLRVTECQDRLASYSENTFCEWFQLQTDKQTVEVHRLSGLWADRLTVSKQSVTRAETADDSKRSEDGNEFTTAPSSADSIDLSWTLRTRLMPPSLQYKDEVPSWLTAPPITNPIKPLQNPLAELEGKLIRRCRWSPNEMDSIETWNAGFEQLLTSSVLLKSDKGEPLIFRLTHKERLGEGKIFIVANGAPFLNASLVDPSFLAIGRLLVQECLPAERVALLSYSNEGIQIYDGEEADLRGAGLEMLLNWPLSAITMSAALLGVVAFAYLLPILGRPQELPSESVSDFGLHVEAIGQMLHETEDLAYARSAVSEYFRTVRGEHPPNWLESG